jgi:hypothetical protein
VCFLFLLFLGWGISCLVVSMYVLSSGRIFSISSRVWRCLILLWIFVGVGGVFFSWVWVYVCFLGCYFGLG